VAAPPPNLALPEAEPPQQSALSAVFRRIASDEPEPPSGPQLLGFAELVTEVPPVEGFLPLREEAPASTNAAPIEIAVLEATRSEIAGLEPLDQIAPATPPSGRAGRLSPSRNRRVYRRVRVPADIEIDGVPCMLIDISIGGFAATGVSPIEPNTIVPITIRLTIDGIEVGTQLDARIVYVTQGRSSGRFIDLSPSQMAFLRYIVTWRGEPIGAAGTTALLDAIAGGAERGFSPGSFNASDGSPRSRWWTGLIGRKVNPPR
jgi:hypothetical protein